MPPWERYNPNAAPPAQPGPWTNYMAPTAQPEAEWQQPGVLAPVQFKKGGGEWRWAMPQVLTDAISAIEAPGKAMRGDYGLELDPVTMQPTAITDEMLGDAMGGAGFGLTTMNPAA